MLDRLPVDILQAIVCRLGERPEGALRTCRATWRLAHDTRALVLWLQETFGYSGAIFSLISVRAVVQWEEQRVLEAMNQLTQSSCHIGDATQAGCVLFWATKQGMARVLDLLLGHFSAASVSFLNSLLKTAAAQGHDGCVSVLLAKGADPNVDGGRPLKAATEAGCVGCVRALLDAGADLHAGAECALRLCAAAGSPAHVEVMALLLERGADVHAKADEALSLAVERSNAEAVAQLLLHGASASARQVLESAASTGCARVVRLLLAHGAPPDADGGRPLRAAAEAGAVEVVRQLLDAGARCGANGAGPAHRRSTGMRPPQGGAAGSGRALARPSLEIARLAAPFHAAYGGSSDGQRPSSWHSGSGCMAVRPGTSAGVRSGPLTAAGTAGGQRIEGPASPASDVGTSSTGSDGKDGAVACPACGSGQIRRVDSMDFDDAQRVLFAEERCEACDKVAGAASGSGPDGEVEGSGGAWDDDDGYGAGGEALCCALCAGEAEVCRVLLERGARVQLGALRCWRQWHRYPGVMAVLQRHRLLGDGPCCLQQNATRSNTSGFVAAARPPPHPPHQSARLPYAGLTSRPSQPIATSMEPRGCSAGAGPLPSSSWTGVSVAAGCACGPPPCSPALQQILREALVAAAGEGAEAAVRLFLTWGAPGTQPDAVMVTLHASAGSLDGTCSGGAAGDPATAAAVPTVVTAATEAAAPALVASSSAGGLGLFTPDCLSSALTAAAAANRPVIVRQLLQHQAGGEWQRAALHPAALHAAVADGHLEVVRLLLEAGVTQATLQPSLAAPGGMSSSATSSGRQDACAGGSWGTGAGPGEIVRSSMANHEFRIGIPHQGLQQQQQRFSPPPPPLQAEAWGTVVLCAAAGCKAGSTAAAAATALLLQHGFGACARDALRLVACGRVPTWRDEPASAILAVAFASSS